MWFYLYSTHYRQEKRPEYCYHFKNLNISATFARVVNVRASDSKLSLSLSLSSIWKCFWFPYLLCRLVVYLGVLLVRNHSPLLPFLTTGRTSDFRIAQNKLPAFHGINIGWRVNSSLGFGKKKLQTSMFISIDATSNVYIYPCIYN